MPVQIPHTDANGKTTYSYVVSHAKSDHLGRKIFDELQLGKGLMNRKFTYHEGKITDTHEANDKKVSDAQTTLVKQIEFADGRTIQYEYDAEERITKVIDSVDGTYEYTYDALGQLLTEKKKNVTVNTMTYDNYGNIKTKNGKTYTYDATWKDKLLSTGDGSIGNYDLNGNPQSYLGNTLVWEKGRQLKQYGANSYKYNNDGIRIQKTTSTEVHDYILDGTNIVKEVVTDICNCPKYTNEYLYDLDGTVCGLKHNGTAYYFYKNLQGDVVAITDDAGAAVARYTYDAWGVPTIVSDNSVVGIATINPFRYRSYYYDTETELYYLQSRYYDPAVGRFINADYSHLILCYNPNKELFNYFSYCQNSVTNKNDSFGAFSIPTALISFGIDAIVWAVCSPTAIGWAVATQPLKAMMKVGGKEMVKKSIQKILPRFIDDFVKVLIKIATKLLPIVKKAVGWLFRKWAKNLTAQGLAAMIGGGLGSILAGGFLNAIITNITMILSVGGFLAGVWDYFSDWNFNGWIKLW